MKTYTYQAEFEHGGAEGEVQATDSKDAKAKVTAMYEGQRRDTTDADGNPAIETTVVTKVTVKLAKD